MNKTELVNTIAQRTGQSAGAVGEVLTAFEGVVTEAVAAGDKVQMPGFLSFSKTERAARMGRNPSTGEEIKIAASITPKIKAGKSFKDAMSA